MTIYRIHQDDSYLVFNIPSQEVLSKLGRNYPVHIDRSPIKYSAVWNEPLNIKFLPSVGSKATEIPDISVSDGRIFLNEKAYDALGDELANDGEFLPVIFDGGTGVIFNPLTIAEDLEALDETLTSYDRYENLEHFGFKEDKLRDTAIFRARIDKCYGIFVTERLTAILEKTRLSGFHIQPDVADFTGEASGEKH